MPGGASGCRRRGRRRCRGAWCSCARCWARPRSRPGRRATAWWCRPTRSTPCRFERHVARARELLTLGEPDRAAYVVDEALGLWRGRALVDLDGWEPGRVEATRLEAAAVGCRGAAPGRDGAGGPVPCGPRRGAGTGDRGAAARAPLDAAGAWPSTRRAGRAMRCAPCTGPAGSWPRSWVWTRAPTWWRWRRRSCARTRRWSPTSAPEPSPVCPYMGLVPYDVGDADAFFGRDPAVSECLRRLADAGVLAVVGPSGSGKSSVVRAGIAAALERDGRQVVVRRAGCAAHGRAVGATARPLGDRCWWSTSARRP